MEACPKNTTNLTGVYKMACNPWVVSIGLLIIKFTLFLNHNGMGHFEQLYCLKQEKQFLQLLFAFLSISFSKGIYSERKNLKQIPLSKAL